MAVGVITGMESLVKRRANRKDHGEKEQHRQETSQRRFCSTAKPNVVSFQLHLIQVQSSTRRGPAQAGTQKVVGFTLRSCPDS